jgi:hypothetical protein
VILTLEKDWSYSQLLKRGKIITYGTRCTVCWVVHDVEWAGVVDWGFGMPRRDGWGREIDDRWLVGQSPYNQKSRYYMHLHQNYSFLHHLSVK